MRRYPLQALMDAAQVKTYAQLRRTFPMSGTEYRRVIDQGLSVKQADRWAVRLGFHPSQVWETWERDEFDDLSVVCAERSCEERFVPVRKGHMFCSRRCGTRHHMQEFRDRHRDDEVYRAKRRAERAAYYAECAEYVRADRRRYYAANREREIEANRRRRGAA